MPKISQKGFTSPVIILALIILGAAVIGIIIYKVNFEEPHQGSEKNTETTELTSPSPSPSLKPSLRPTIRPSAKPSIKPSASPTPQPSQSPSSSSNNSSNNSSASTSPSSTATPTPTPTQASCSGLCFDRSSTSVEVTQGSGAESGGSTAFAFNLTGDGSHGFLMNTSGLPAGMDVLPSSGGFGENTYPIRIWVNNNGNVPFGTYNGTITLKQGPSYSEVGTLSITVTYKQ